MYGGWAGRLPSAMTGRTATFKLIEGPEAQVEVYGRDVNVTAQGTTIPLEK